MTLHSNGISAKNFWLHLGFGLYKTAWPVYTKVRRAKTNAPRATPFGQVDVDETALLFGSAREAAKSTPNVGVQGHKEARMMLVAGAIEIVRKGRPGRLPLVVIPDYSVARLKALLDRNVDASGELIADRWYGCRNAFHRTAAHSIGDRSALELLGLIHKIYSNLNSWARRIYHGLRRKHLQRQLDEFTFRFNRRRLRAYWLPVWPYTSTNLASATHNMLIKPDVKR